MLWPRRLFIINEMLANPLGSMFIFGAGVIIAVRLHRGDKKSRLWPALSAILLYLGCETAEVNLSAYYKMGSSMWLGALILLIGYLTIGYAAGWLIMDIVYWLKERKRKEKE